jgi:hypothetical protein
MLSVNIMEAILEEIIGLSKSNFAHHGEKTSSTKNHPITLSPELADVQSKRQE